MHSRYPNCIWLVTILGIALSVHEARADEDAEPTAHQAVTHYAKAVESLNAKYGDHLKARDVLAEEFSQVYAQFAAAGQEAQAISQQAQAEFRLWLLAYTQVAESEQALRESGARVRMPSSSSRQTWVDRMNDRFLARQTAQLSSDELNRLQRGNQIQLAQNLNAQRQQKLQMELGKLGAKAQAWSVEDFQMVCNYLSEADVANIRSNLELKSARRLLEAELESNTENIGARLALAVTLMRLAEYDEARSHLNSMVSQGGAVAFFAKSVRAELNMLTGQEPQAKRDLVDSRGLKIPEATLLQARVYAKMREFKTTETLWESLSKNSTYEVIAHCNTALMLISRKPTESQVKRAINEAQLAIDLSGGDDWHCHLTSAVCLAANADKDAAIAACQRAAELAIGNKKQLCLEICDQIRLGKDVVWQY